MLKKVGMTEIFHKKSARRLLSGVGTGAKVRRYRKHGNSRKIEGLAQMRQAKGEVR